MRFLVDNAVSPLVAERLWQVAEALEEGAVVVIKESRIRVRALPFSSS